MGEGPLQLLGAVDVPDYARLGPADAALIAASLLSFLPNPNANTNPSPSPNPNPDQASLLSFLPPQSAARQQLNTTVAAPTPTPTPTPTQTLPLPQPQTQPELQP